MADWLDDLPGLKDVQDTNNTTLARRAKIKIHGAGVTVADDPVNERVDVEIDAASATLAQVGDNPVDSDAGAAAIGSGTRAAKWDHKHRVLTGTPVAIGGALSAGTSAQLSRADHVHTVGFAEVNATLAAADADVDVNSRKITSLADPTAAQDAATKAYVDNVATGLRDFKQSVRAIATSNITLSGEQTIDGVAVVAGDRVLVAGQSTGAENGIYVASASGWTRATDADTSAEVTAGMFTFVSEGTTHGNTGWVLTTDDPIVLDTDALTFAQFSAAPLLSSSTPSPVAAAGSAGTSVQASAADHAHAHDDQAGGTLHAAVVAGGDNGFMTGADKATFDAEFARATLQTTDDTPTVIATHTPVDESIGFVTARVVALQSDGSVGAGYEVSGTYRRDGGTTVLVGSAPNIVSHEDGGAASWDCTLVVSTPDVQVQVTGAAATTINWACMLSVVSGP